MNKAPAIHRVTIEEHDFQWDLTTGTLTAREKPVVLLRIDTTLTALMQSTQRLVGTRRFLLAMQREGQLSTKNEWPIIRDAPCFEEGFQRLSHMAALAGWGEFELIFIDRERKECIFHSRNCWESRYQREIGVTWGCGMTAGKLAGYCSRLFQCNCWTEQTAFADTPDGGDTFIVRPSERTVDGELARLISEDEGTRRDMSLALHTLQQEVQNRLDIEKQLRLTRKRLHDQLRKQTSRYRASKERYSLLVENTDDLILYVNHRGNLTFINSAAQKIFRLDDDEYRGRMVCRYVESFDWLRLRRWRDKVLAKNGAVPPLELSHRPAGSDREIIIQWTAKLLHDTNQQLIGMIATGRNVTEIRRIEENYINLFTQMHNGFALHRIICEGDEPVDYVFLSVNPAFERLTGFSADQLAGRTIRSIMPDIDSFWIDTYGRVALSGEPINFERYWEDIDKYLQITVYRTAPGQFACLYQDVSYRKKAEQEKARLEEQLRQRHKMEAIGTLAGGIAHDFNNILAAIIGYTDIALGDIPAWSPARKQLDEVLRAGNRAKQLVRQILSFSRSDEQDRRPVSLPPLLREVVAFLQASIPEKIKIELEIPKECGYILADQTQIHQVLMNICTNAGQAIEEERGSIHIRMYETDGNNPELRTLAALRTDRFVAISVTDSGVGIEDRDMQRIFDPYFTTKEFGKGTGLGLAVAHGIIKGHQGHIRVSSVHGKGTTVSIYFPRLSAQTAREHMSSRSASPAAPRILVIDDDPSIMKMLITLLQRQGYDAQGYTSALQALEVFKADSEAYNLVITDHNMPEMAGAQLAMKLLDIRSKLPIILCSGYAAQLDEMRVTNTGISAFMLKPVNIRELTEIVRRLLAISVPTAASRS